MTDASLERLQLILLLSEGLSTAALDGSGQLLVVNVGRNGLHIDRITDRLDCAHAHVDVLPQLRHLLA